MEIENKVVRAMCKDYFNVDHARICGTTARLRTDIDWYAFTLSGFVKFNTNNPPGLKIYFVAYIKDTQVMIYKYKCVNSPRPVKTEI